MRVANVRHDLSIYDVGRFKSYELQWNYILTSRHSPDRAATVMARLCLNERGMVLPNGFLVWWQLSLTHACQGNKLAVGCKVHKWRILPYAQKDQDIRRAVVWISIFNTGLHVVRWLISSWTYQDQMYIYNKQYILYWLTPSWLIWTNIIILWSTLKASCCILYCTIIHLMTHDSKHILSDYCRVETICPVVTLSSWPDQTLR